MDDQPKSTTEQDADAFVRLATYANFFSSASGRLILQCLRESLDSNTFRHDPYESAYAQGRRSVYLDILAAVGQGLELLDSPKPTIQTTAELPATIEEL